MKDEEFNDFLRNRADQFEMKPSSGSFGAVMGKMQKTKKKRLLWVFLPLLLVSAVGVYTLIDEAPQQTVQDTVKSTQLAAQNAGKTATGNTSEVIQPKATENTIGETQDVNAINTQKAVSNKKTIKSFVPLPQQKTPNTFTEEMREPRYSSPLLMNKWPLLPVLFDNTIKLFPVAPVILVRNPIEPEKKTVAPQICEEKNAVQVSFTQYFVKGGNVNTDEAYKDIIAMQAKSNVLGQGVPNFQQSNPPEKTSEIVWKDGFGINAAYRGILSKKWGVQVGFTYSVMNNTQNFNEYTEFWDTASVERLNPTTNEREVIVERTSFWTKSASVKYTSRLHTLSIPLSIYYKLVSNCKWGIEVSGGAAYNYLGASTTYETVGAPAFNSGKNIITLTYNKSYFSALAGFTGHYYLTKKMAVFTGFRAQMPLQQLYTNPNLKSSQKLSLLGIEAGIRFKF